MKIALLILFVPYITIAMDPAKFTAKQIEAFQKGKQMDEQESAEFISQNIDDIFNLFSQLGEEKKKLKTRLGQEKYNALAGIWTMENVEELARECLNGKRPFEFNKKVRALVTDQDITTYLPNDSVTLTLIQFQALSMPDLEFAMSSVAMMPYQAPSQAPTPTPRNPFSRLKKWITRK